MFKAWLFGAAFLLLQMIPSASIDHLMLPRRRSAGCE